MMMKPPKKLQNFSNMKTKIKATDIGCVYQLNCRNRNYIGATERYLETKVSEDKNELKKEKEP